jgi:glycosyltransferase involved in cell wall biosynthesis
MALPRSGWELPVTAVSVVIPTHDRKGWLRQALATVLWQREVNVDAIVVDDGSTDGTADMVRSLSDPRIRLVRHDRSLGASLARNRGADEATHEWIAFLDDDDLWAPDKLHLQIDAASRDGRDWAYTGSVNVGDDLEVIGGGPPPSPETVATNIFRFNAVPGGGSNVVVRRDTLRRVGLFDPRLRNGEDWEMWIRFAELGPPAWVPDPLLAYRVHRTNASLDIAELLAGVELIELNHRTSVDRGVLHRWIAESCLRAGQRGAALRHLAIAARRGQVVGVTHDLSEIIHRRLARRRLLPRRGPRHPDWVARAESWLSQVRAMETLRGA